MLLVNVKCKMSMGHGQLMGYFPEVSVSEVPDFVLV